MTDRDHLDPEDTKLVTLARSARARAQAQAGSRSGSTAGAAVRDTDGRTYVAASVELPSLRLSALQVAVAMAVSSGARGLEAAVITGDGRDDAGAAAVHDLAPAAPIHHVQT